VSTKKKRQKTIIHNKQCRTSDPLYSMAKLLCLTDQRKCSNSQDPAFHLLVACACSYPIQPFQTVREALVLLMRKGQAPKHQQEVPTRSQLPCILIWMASGCRTADSNA
jgi:hypothetical protein